MKKWRRNKKTDRQCGRRILGMLSVVLGVLLLGSSVKAEGFYENSFLTFSPDRKAWTVQEALPSAGDATNNDNPSCWYSNTEAILTGKISSLSEPEVGQHYYHYQRHGVVPIQRWQLAHRKAKCIHEPMVSFHGVPLVYDRCYSNYYSGWNSYCADCGEKVIDFNLYMSKEKLAQITEIDLELDYYYLCPTCGHLEQGVDVRHTCKAISANRYRVQYLPNGGNVAGFMQSSFHIYGNADRFEGEVVTPNKRLSKNIYSRPGFLFVGWNTEPNGSGMGFCDEQEILNLSEENYDEENGTGTVRLYAQWKKITGSLEIDPAGGTFLGNSGSTTVAVGYEEKYYLPSSYLTPPMGYTVKFDVRGGKALEDLRERRVFYGWKLISPAKGSLDGEEYRFLGADGEKDCVRALYQSEGIRLPLPEKTGSGFAGWYYDETFTKMAGKAGDLFMPQRDITLYARWVELALEARVNLKAHEGKGAVDLNWHQADGNQKVYLLYQKREGEEFQRIYGTEDGSSPTMQREFQNTQQTEKYRIEQSGFYRIVAKGAKGQDWDGVLGGFGGKAEGVFYLSAGDELSITIGSTDGQSRGGSGWKYGGGGGCTMVSSGKEGTLLIAGGGGGASPAGSGGEGGSESSLREEAVSEGESGEIGGGGGRIGGKAGIYQQHIHTETCLHVHLGNETEGGECYKEQTTELTCHRVVAGPFLGDERAYCDDCVRKGIPGGNSSMRLHQWVVDHKGCGAGVVGVGGWWQCENCGKIGYRWGCGMERPTTTDHKWIKKEYVLNCTKQYDCGDPPGRIVGSGGGSNYVNQTIAVSYEKSAGEQNGSGIAMIQALNVGFMDQLELSGAYAPDQAAPERIDLQRMQMEAIEDHRIKLAFERPADRGTVYYHQVHSYLAGQESVLSSSNITETEVATGIAGYYYLVDSIPGTQISVQNGRTQATFCGREELLLRVGETTGFLHIAAMDRAGNIGETVCVELPRILAEVAWLPCTESLVIDSMIEGVEYGSVTKADGAENIYYVKADGRTPFLLKNTGYLSGTPRNDYQVDRMTYGFRTGEGALQGEYSVRVPLGSVEDIESEYSGETLGRQTGGIGILQWGMYSKALRTEKMCRVQVLQSFCLEKEYHGKRIQVIPSAGAYLNGNLMLSDRQEDETHGLWLIADAQAPEILGLQDAERILQDRDEEVIDLVAIDSESGVGEFAAVIRNMDNGGESYYYPESDGHIRIRVEDTNPLFMGEVQLQIRVVDRVGNENTVKRGADDFGVTAVIVRCLAPHDPIFKRGESGILMIKARGYVERLKVEFPENIVGWDEELNRTYLYDPPRDVAWEEILFMIPLEEVEDREYQIHVTVYKGEEFAEVRPVMCTLEVAQTVLGELRTRLR